MGVLMTPRLKPADRRHLIGGSDARIIMGGDEGALMRLWREKRGEVEPQDLSGNLIVQLGLATEDLNRRWYEANTGQVITDVQRQVWHPALRWTAATLDARVVAGTPLDSYLEPRPLPFLQCRFHTPGPPLLAFQWCHAKQSASCQRTRRRLEWLGRPPSSGRCAFMRLISPGFRSLRAILRS